VGKGDRRRRQGKGGYVLDLGVADEEEKTKLTFAILKYGLPRRPSAVPYATISASMLRW
jgi:hypothetical protein